MLIALDHAAVILEQQDIGLTLNRDRRQAGTRLREVHMRLTVGGRAVMVDAERRAPDAHGMSKDTAEAEPGRQDSTRELPPTGLPVSEDEVMAAMMAVFKRAGTSPHIVYAAQKTGRIVTVENQHLLSEEELAEWNAAVEEYRQQRRVRRRWKR
jgi:hypothetical protein